MTCKRNYDKPLITTCMVHLAMILFFVCPLCVSAAPPPQEFSLATVESGRWRPELSAQGRVHAWKEATLSTPFPALVTSLSVEAGQRVIRGQKVAQLEIPAMKRLVSRVQAAQASNELAGKRVAGVKRRVAEKLATQDEQLQLEESLSQANSELNAAWQELENALLPLGQSVSRRALQEELQHQPAVALSRRLSELRAPFSGTVARSLVTEGSRVTGGTPLLTLVDTSRVRVELLIPRSDVASWQQGEAFATLPANKRIMLRSLVETPRIDPVTGLAVIQYQLDNPGGILLNDAWIPVTLAGKPQQVLWVPESAVVGRAGRTWCVRRQGTAYVAVEVGVGTATRGRIPVLSGLRTGDRVVTQGAYLLLYRDLKQLMKFED